MEIKYLESEIFNVTYESKEFLKYSSINLHSSFDLIEDDPNKYNIGYKYFDECFGITIDFERSFYEDRDLKPRDLLTLMFSFKYLGSYKSTLDKQDIRWEAGDIETSEFK